MQGRPKAVAVAVVEDDASVLRSVQRLLNAYGFAAEGFSSAEAEAMQLGCVAYLRKPFPARSLINALANATGGLPTNSP